MGIRYQLASDVKSLVTEIASKLDFSHIKCDHVFCFRSRGSKSCYTTARIHGLSKVWQEALSTEPYYVLEVISERYDRLSLDDKEKVIIHELLHIPHSFAGGFRHHKRYVTQRKIDNLHRALKALRSN